MTNKNNSSALRSLFTPVVWLTVSAGSLFMLANFAPGMAVSVTMAVCVSAAIIGLVAWGNEIDMPAVPVLGAGLFALMTWISISIMPDVAVGTDLSGGWVLTAKTLVLVSAVLFAMPVLALFETLVSIALVQVLARRSGASVLGSEMRVAAMIGAKFGGLAGTINR